MRRKASERSDPESKYKGLDDICHKQLKIFGDFLSGDRIPDKISINCSSGVMRIVNSHSPPGFSWDPLETSGSYDFELPGQAMIPGWLRSSNGESAMTIMKTNILVGRLGNLLDRFEAPESIFMLEGPQVRAKLIGIIERERGDLQMLDRRPGVSGAVTGIMEIVDRIDLIKYVLDKFGLEKSWAGAIIIPSRYMRVPEFATVLELALYSSQVNGPSFLAAAYDFGTSTNMKEEGTDLEHLVYGNQLALSMKR